MRFAAPTEGDTRATSSHPTFHLTRVLQTKPAVTIGKECIAPTPSAGNLGATFASIMSMEPHINIMVRNINYHIRWIGKIRGHLDNGTKRSGTSLLYLPIEKRTVYTVLVQMLLHDDSFPLYLRT